MALRDGPAIIPDFTSALPSIEMDPWSAMESPKVAPATKATEAILTPSPRRTLPVLGRVACFRTLPRLAVIAEKHQALAFLDACLRGVGQCNFQNSPLSGLLFLVALGLSPQGLRMVAFALLGVVSATAFSCLLGLDRHLRAAGLHGYNATLVGCAVHTFFTGDAYGVASLVIVLLSCLSVLLATATAAALPPGLPTLTFPFQVSMWIYVLSTQLYPRLEIMAFPAPRLVLNATLSTVSYDAAAIVQTIFSGIAETCLVGDWFSGVVMLLGIFLCSPTSAVAALLASTAATLLAIAMQAPSAGLLLGLHGYNPVLNAIALSGFFLAPRHWRTVVLVTACVGATFLFNCATSSVFTILALPVLTWPFTIMTWVGLLASQSMPDLARVPLADLTTPEDHYEALHRTPTDSAA
ncbi:hypothetical protein SPRG_08145 [Saprolegnia parasitica CBS 223.65]|uniref:Urea transporter n=1 Tax=Saprolegnia parasitica (strain CBS 223.65) TaxID=695850 RepID=A0A067CCE5_SAPPC|nr:hypothetical protein SPRG_08145 [Saprolegnia parasitica CBS 223.65]KDO26855.1 hypothetical protein SPRG_08145 [Saprolegnia parasitica CBS 223.65]|eukprot:XP_012202500.1 hypothetical protein SPRG_08145 [Saprolegnia parasitica CBS 223.65]